MFFAGALKGDGFGEGGDDGFGDVDRGWGGVDGEDVGADEGAGLGEDGVGAAEFGGALEGREVDGFLQDGVLPCL